MKFNEIGIQRFVTTPPYDHEGFLYKRGDLIQKFHRRYFILKGNLLAYFGSRGASKPLGVIVLENCIILVQTIDVDFQYPYCIEIFDGGRTHVLSLNTEHNMRTWLQKLRCASNAYKLRLIVAQQYKLNEYEKIIENFMSRKVRKHAADSTPPILPPTHHPSTNHMPTIHPLCPHAALMLSSNPVLVKTQLHKSVSELDGSLQKGKPPPMDLTSDVKPPKRAQSARCVDSRASFFSDLAPTHSETGSKLSENNKFKNPLPDEVSASNLDELQKTYRRIVLKDFEDARLDRHQKSISELVHNNSNKN